jgi:HlyD family secretion protein
MIKRLFLWFWSLLLKLFFFSILLLGGAAVLWGPQELLQKIQGKTPEQRKPDEEILYTKAQRNTLQISMTERGSLRATKTVSVFINTVRELTFVWVETEGTLVKKGDVIARFETQEFKDQILEQEKERAQFLENLEVAKKDVGISQSTGELSIAQAETSLKDAEEDLKKFKQLEAPQKLEDLNNNRAKAKKDIVSARSTLEEKREITDSQLFNGEEDRNQALEAVDQAETKLQEALQKSEEANLQWKLYRTYDYKKQIRNKLEAVENAKLALKKAQIGATNYLAQKKAEVRKIEDSLKRSEKQIQELKEVIEKCELKSPVGGRILYGIPGRGWPRKEDIAVGKKVWDGYTFMSIPDESAFLIDTFIAEESRHRVKGGDPVQITLEAIPELKLKGKIETIDGFAAFHEGGPKSYKTQIAIETSDPRLVSGMSVTVEIIGETLENVLLLPIEAVFNKETQIVCYLRQGEKHLKRLLKVGKSNDHFVEILEGLQGGEEVSLVIPPEEQEEQKQEASALSPSLTSTSEKKEEHVPE